MRRNYPLVALGMALLVIATIAGLGRAGIGVLPPELAPAHGALMVAGFFGTLISLERAFAAGRGWAYLIPLLSAAGGLGVVAGIEQAPLLLVLSAAGFVLLSAQFVSFRPNLAAATMGLGALALLAGNVLWYLLGSVAATPFWGAFLLLTIAGERIELAELIKGKDGIRRSFLLSTGVYIAGVCASLLDYGTGLRLSGAGMLLLAAWLLRYDVAMESIRTEGLPRFAGFALVSGYLWLLAGGLIALAFAGQRGYDMLLHSLFLGFVFSMVFGHAPVIFPALLGREMRFMNSFYVHLALLHISLLIRLAGNFLSPQLTALGSLLNALAIFIFLANNAAGIILAGSSKEG
ncbi:MAG: hypothetical protein GXO66_03370 [Euryarchaeota archaeon]|nr:hypothetical protein [Euryarchaeota archaeon]